MGGSWSMRFEFCEYDEDDGLMVSHVTIGRVVYSSVQSTTAIFHEHIYRHVFFSVLGKKRMHGLQFAAGLQIEIWVMFE